MSAVAAATESTGSGAFIELDRLSKSFGIARDKREVLSNVSLDIHEGEFICILGFSGSGKSTLINLLAGLIEPDTGSLTIKGKAVTGPGSERALMFQNYSLLPWLTVRQNVALAVEAARDRLDIQSMDEYVDKYVDMVGLIPAADKRPAELSGGMRQRVALARALAMDPEVLLLDEPLSALDALTRANMQDELEEIWRRDRKTVIMVTNDVDEAILLADRIVPLKPGPRATLGPAFSVDLDRPRNRQTMNHDPAFIKLRNAVTGYLVDVGRQASAAVDTPAVMRPDLVPASPSFWIQRIDENLVAKGRTSAEGQ